MTDRTTPALDVTEDLVAAGGERRTVVASLGVAGMCQALDDGTTRRNVGQLARLVLDGRGYERRRLDDASELVVVAGRLFALTGYEVGGEPAYLVSFALERLLGGPGDLQVLKRVPPVLQ